MSGEINKKNILSFLEGNAKYYYHKLFGIPQHMNEQILYRLSKCQDCLANDTCLYCGCPPVKKAFVIESCNNGERFPDLMNKEDWEKFKEKNNES